MFMERQSERFLEWQPMPELFHQMFEEHVDRVPDALAVVHQGESLTYAELNARANHLAYYLRDREIGPDQLVGICVERGLEMAVGLLGVFKAGGAYVPLDPSYPPERLKFMLDDASPQVLLTQAHLRGRLPSNDIQTIVLDEQWSEIAQQSQSNLEAAKLGLGSHHLAYVIYTSGSAGQPKGVMIEHRQILNFQEGIEVAYRQSAPCQRVALNASLNFDASIGQFAQLLSGRTLFIVPEAYRRAPPMLLRFLSENRIHAVDCTPSQLRTWISAGLLDDSRCQLHLVLVGGESIDGELWSSLAEYSETNFYNVYGPTECTIDATMTRLKGDTTAPHIGRPMANNHIYILDHAYHPTSIGVTGEIYIGGESVARGYLNRTELTCERFIADPFSTDPQAKMYKTGDFGRWRADGNIEYLGRDDSQVKIRGFRVELGEIETQLLRHPQVKEAVVLAREDEPGEHRLVAYVVGQGSSKDTDSVLSARTLRRYLEPTLPDYMLPGFYVMLDSLPLTLNGKLDRRSLPAPQSRPEEMGEYVPPRTEMEHTLADIWTQLLRVNRVGMHDSFLDLGGQSLHVMKLIAKLSRELKVDLSLVEVLQSPTIEQMAKLMESRKSSDVEASNGELEYEEGVL